MDMLCWGIASRERLSLSAEVEATMISMLFSDDRRKRGVEIVRGRSEIPNGIFGVGVQF